MVDCVLSQLKLSELNILAVEKASAFSTAKKVELLGLYPIRIVTAFHRSTEYDVKCE